MRKFHQFICLLISVVLCFSLCSCGETPMTIENCDNGHDMKQVSYTAPTCKTTGSKVFSCTRCGYTETETLLTIDCDYQIKSIIPSTCTTKGSQLLECSMCHTQKTETLPLVDHNYVYQNTIPSTCLNYGKTIEICSECRDEKITYNNTLLNHRFDSTGFCSECGISKYYFDTDFQFSWFNYEISISLTPIFNNSNKNTADHWASHTVYVTLSCYQSYIDDSPIVFQCDSKTNEKNCFWSAESEDKTTPLHCSIDIGKVGPYLQKYTITISCDGFETFSKTYAYR